MPRFLTVAELTERHGASRLEDLVGYLPEDEQEGPVLRSLEWAESRLRSLVSSRYGRSLPGSPETTSDEIKGLVADLARWNLELTLADQASPNVAELGERALAQLRDVARGLASLDLPESVAEDRVQPTIGVSPKDRPSFTGPLLARLPGGGR